ncbi:12668_t:CDS:2, partial [Entrophospora sp. SA101]
KYLQIDEDDLKLLQDQKITGYNFFLLKEKHLIKCGLKTGLVLTLCNLIQELKNGWVMYSKVAELDACLLDTFWWTSFYHPLQDVFSRCYLGMLPGYVLDAH